MNNDSRLALQAMKEVYPTIQEIKDAKMVVAFMGLLFDQYCADRRIKQEEKSAHLMELVAACNFVNAVMEPLAPTTKEVL